MELRIYIHGDRHPPFYSRISELKRHSDLRTIHPRVPNEGVIAVL
jgi:hypothetical protein